VTFLLIIELLFLTFIGLLLALVLLLAIIGFTSLLRQR
jgi:hypothetical protein